MTPTKMYDASSPPTAFDPSVAWGGYLESVHPYAVWPRAALKAAIAESGGLVPIWGGPLTAEDYAKADPETEARAALDQVKTLGGNQLVVAHDTEERAWTADPKAALAFAVDFALTLDSDGALAVSYGPTAFLDALRPLLANKTAPWVADWENLDHGYPSPVWPAGDRAWQYAGNVEVAGKNVDVSTLEARFPLIRATGHPTRLHLRQRHAVRDLATALPGRHDAIAEPDRSQAVLARDELTRVLDLG